MMNPKTVLIADDESIIRLDLRAMLQDLGYKVVGECSDGESLVALARELRPSIVLSDIKMPGSIDGIEAARILREERVAPVVLISAYSQRQLVERAARAGASGYLVKPIRESDLMPAIEIALANSHALDTGTGEVHVPSHLETRQPPPDYDADTTLLFGALLHRMGNALGIVPALLRRARWDGEADEYLTQAESKIEEALTIVRRFRPLSVPVPSQQIDVRDVILRTIHDANIPENVRTQVEWRGSEAVVVEGNPQILTELLLNLFSNAVQAMPDGGELKVACRAEAQGWLEVRVADTGGGMTEQVVSRLFKSSISTRRAQGGQGFGLLLSHGMAERLGGTLQLESTVVNQGSTFLLRLPIKRAVASTL